MSAPRDRPRLYFSFRSPYSWLTVRRLQQAVPTAFTELDWTPYWDPDRATADGLCARGGEFHYVQMSRAKHRYMLMDTKRIARQHGISMAWPVDVDPHWELPHLGWLLARRLDRAEAFYHQVVEARWGRGEDVCDPTVLRGCATRAGLPAERVVSAVDDPDLRSEGVDCLYQAYLDDVFGIPYFRLGKERFWGLERLDTFLDYWRSGNHPGDLIDAGAPPHHSYDLDTPGGCG